MPLVQRETGYPVDTQTAAEAKVETPAAAEVSRSRVIGSSDVQAQPSAKDRSIIRQTAWKIVGPAMANWTGSPDAWFDKCVEMRAKVEQDMLGA